MPRKRVSAQQFAKMKGVTDSRIRQLALEGRIPEAEKIGNQWIIPENARILYPPERNRGFDKIREWLRTEDWDRDSDNVALQEFIRDANYWIKNT